MADEQIQKLIRQINQGDVGSAVALAAIYERNALFKKKFYMFSSAPVRLGAWGVWACKMSSPDNPFLVNKIKFVAHGPFVITVEDDYNQKWIEQVPSSILDSTQFDPPFLLPPRTPLTITLEDRAACSNQITFVLQGELTQCLKPST